MRPTVTPHFEMPDGGTGRRGSSEDIPTFHRRLFGRLRSTLGESNANEVLIPGVNAYNEGNYETALSFFASLTERTLAAKQDLYPHVNVCRRVLRAVLDETDRAYVMRRDSRWNRVLSLLRLSDLPWKLRCKYCGHYTYHIDPMAPAHANKCDRCGRTYAAPDFVWDSIDGQAYIYYQKSVPEEIFYREFEEAFRVTKGREKKPQ